MGLHVLAKQDKGKPQFAPKSKDPRRDSGKCPLFFFFCSCFQLFVQSNFSFELLKAVPSLVLALFFAHPAVFYGHAENTRPNDKSD